MNIYVGNLPPGVTVDELRAVFILFGEVLSVSIMNDRYIGSGQPTEYGYVQMASKSEGQAAVLGLKDRMLRGQPIRLVEALPLSDKGHLSESLHTPKARNYSTRRRNRER